MKLTLNLVAQLAANISYFFSIIGTLSQLEFKIPEFEIRIYFMDGFKIEFLVQFCFFVIKCIFNSSRLLAQNIEYPY